MSKFITKPFVILFLVVVLPFWGYSQAPTPVWVNDIGGSGDSKPTGLITDSQNNIYVTGYFSATVDFDPSAGVKNLTSVGGYDIYVAKYKPDGTLVWATSMGGNGLDQANCLTVDANGDVTVVGQFQSSVLTAGAFSMTNQGAEDTFIIHLDANGNVVWAKSIGGNGTDRGEQVSADAQGNVTMTSIFQNTVQVGTNTVSAPGGQFNGLIVKYDASGNLLWYINQGTSGDTEVYGNGTDSNGNIVVSGYFTGSVDFDPLGVHDVVNSTGSEYFVAKYSPAGKLMWVNTGKGSIVYNGSVLSIDANNDVYFGGAFSPSITFGSTTLTVQGAQDVFLAKYSSTGTLQYAKDIGGAAGSIFEYQMRNDPNNNDVYLTGYMTGTVDFDPSASVANVSYHGQRDFWVAKYDPNGNYIWAFAEGSPNCDLSLGIELGVDKNSDVISGGSFCSTVNFDPSNCTSHPVTAINSTSDTYIAKYTPSTSSIISNNVITAPNPATLCAPATPGTITASTPTGGSGTYTYQWQNSADGVNFKDISDATSLTYIPAAITTTTYYRRVVSSTCATPLNSNVISIQIQPTLANNALAAPAVTGFCSSGNPANIVGSTATGGDGISYSYQWQSSTDGTNFSNISGATLLSYDPSAVSVTTYYRRIVTSGACTTPLISNVITITVDPAVTNNVITPPNPTTFCGPYNGVQGAGAPIQFTGSTPSGGNGAFSYQWQSSTDNTNFTNISGATAADLLLPAVNVNTWFRRVVTSGNCTTPLVSNSAEIIIQSILANNTITQPAVTAFCGPGNPGVITATTPTGGYGTYTYQWTSSPDNVNFTNIAGATSATYDPPAINTTTYYQRSVVSGSCNVPLVSNSVEIIINAVPSTSVPTTNPVSICAGSPAALSVASPQQGVTYDWYDSPTKTNHLATGFSYTTNPLNANQTFYIEATNTAGCASATLASVQVNVFSEPSISAVSGTKVVCSGTSATLSVQNPQAGFTYNWYSVQSGGSAVFTGATFITPAISGSVSYYVDATNGAGCTSVGRAAINVVINPQPTVSANGASVCPGTAATLTAISGDDNASINWYTTASGGSAVFTGSSFTTPALNANTTYYAEAVDNSTGCISASRAQVRVQMIQPLAAPDVTVSSTTTSSVTFQWTAVSGATGYQVSIDNGQTFTDPSSVSNGLTHTVSGLQGQQSVTIVVRAIGNSPCEQSATSAAVTGTAISPLGNQVFVPNAFTPNGDGKNDIVYVRGPNIRSLKFYVYDQWGELIYSTINQTGGWDGTYKGSKEPVGVYVYYVEAIMNDGTQVNKKGSITLLR